MDLNRAATFLQVVESGGFTAAAAVLGLPTSSVSRSVAKLEDRGFGPICLRGIAHPAIWEMHHTGSQ